MLTIPKASGLGYQPIPAAVQSEFLKKGGALLYGWPEETKASPQPNG